MRKRPNLAIVNDLRYIATPVMGKEERRERRGKRKEGGVSVAMRFFPPG